MSASAVRERSIADAVFGAGLITGVAPATWYLGLSTTTPANDGTGFTEPVGNGYARVAVTNNGTNFPGAISLGEGLSEKRNGTKITFPNPTGSWGIITYWGWFIVASGSLPEWTQALDSTITPKLGNTPVEFDVGQLRMTFA